MGQINLKKTDLPNTPATGRAGIYIDSTNAPILILEDGSEIPLGGTTLEQIYIDAITGGQSPSSENPFITLSQLQALLGSNNSVLYGGVVQWSGTGLVFTGSASGYIIDNQYYEIAQDDTLTLATADATNDRRDTFKLTTTGWDIDTGTPAPTPVAPTVDPITEIDRGDVLLEALATTPTITNEDVYLENVEWVTTSSGTGTFDPADTSDPFAGTKAFKASAIQAGATMIFTRGSDIDLTGFSSIGLQIKLLATMNAGRKVFVQFFNNSDVALSQSVALAVTKTDTTAYQFVAIPLDQMGFSDLTTVRKLRIRYGGTGGAASYGGYLVDNVILQDGFNQPQDSIFTQDEIDAIKDANAPTSANPFATIADITVSGLVETVTGSTVDNTDPLNPVIDAQEPLVSATNIKTINSTSLLGSGDLVTFIEPTEATGAAVSFDKDYIHGNAGAITGNITYSFTGEKRGAVTFMLHNQGTVPTFPAETKIIAGEYTISVDNYIWLCLTKTVSGRVVQVTIGKV